MRKLASILNEWPAAAAVLISGAMIVSTAADDVILPGWLVDLFDHSEAKRKAPGPIPDSGPDEPYAPAPGRDDRTPLPYLSHVFDLKDPALLEKFTGIGPVFWDHSGQGTGTLIAPNLVLTTGHLFAKYGKWHGPFGRTDKPPAPADGRIYLAACGRAYDLKAIHMGDMAPRARLGLDYAIAKLATPACPEAVVLPVAETPDDLASAQDQVLLNMGAYRFADLDRYAEHPLYADRTGGDKHQQYAVFGVKCVATGSEDTGDVADGSTAVILTEGCDGVPGGSGGPLLVSRDGGAGYSVIGVANSYRPNSEYNNYTRIEGAFAKHLAQFVEVTDLPGVASSFAPNTTTINTPGPWLPLAQDSQSKEALR